MLHFYGLAFTLIGYRIIAIFFEKRGIDKDKFIVLGFSFCFAIASIWEIYEYSMDVWFGDYFEEHGITLMQADKGSGEERINDIILAVLSSTVMNLMLLGYLSRSWFKQLVNYNFILNPSKEKL